MPKFLRFGIPTLDELIGQFREDKDKGPTFFGIDFSPDDTLDSNPAPTDVKLEGAASQVIDNRRSDSTSICIIGPDGTGKSVFGMHLASRYLADCISDCKTEKLPVPSVLYVCTDLRYSMA